MMATLPRVSRVTSSSRPMMLIDAPRKINSELRSSR